MQKSYDFIAMKEWNENKRDKVITYEFLMLNDKELLVNTTWNTWEYCVC
jgi:hypothetical protein